MNDERHLMQVIGQLLEQVRTVVLRDGKDGLRPSQFRVIDSVPAEGGITITALAERVGMTKQGIGQFVTQLTADGYLATEANPHDRRERVVRRTQLGHEAIERLSLILQGLEQEWADSVGARRYRDFRAVLDEIARIHRN
jgi:DNA-binding MarR family transcriptional regulator